MLKRSQAKPRIVSQDIAKGIAILIVMLLHTVQVNRTFGSIVAILFGYLMPFFLFMAGYNYSDKGLSVKENLKRRTLQLLKPFLIYSLGVFVIMGIYFIIRGEATVLELLKSFFVFLISKWGANLLGWDMPQVLYQRILGPCWFIQFLIIANIIFIPFSSWVKNNAKRLFSSVILLSGISVVLIDLNIVLPWGIQVAPAIAGLMLFASYLKGKNLIFSVKTKTKWIILNCFACILTIALFQLNYNSIGFLAAGEIGKIVGGIEVYAFYVMAIVGSYFIINFSRLVEKFKLPTKFLSWLGKNSLLILMFHMSIVHIVKDVLGLEQRNAAEQLFGDHINPLEVIAAIVVVILVSLFVKGWTTLKNKKVLQKG